ncbi:MAG: hypothetical protein V1893_03675 [Candidatus Omnitrophota bacterium]
MRICHIVILIGTLLLYQQGGVCAEAPLAFSASLDKASPTKEAGEPILVDKISPPKETGESTPLGKTPPTKEAGEPILVDKTEYKSSEPIYITFSLKNNTDKPIYVNKRFYLSSETVPPDDREIYLEVTGPSGEKLPCTYSYPTGFPKCDYFELLEPAKEVVSEKRNLAYYFDFKQPGSYTIVAVYQNVFGSEIGIDAYKERLVSQAVVLTITQQ